MRVNAHEPPSLQHCADADVVWQPPVGAWVRIRSDLDGRCPEGAHDGAEPGTPGWW